jgi:class 3 adenylate cyclase
MVPHTQYAHSGELSLAYQVVGDGPIDLLFVPGWVSQVEHCWEDPALARFFEAVATFARLIVYDRRGTGLSASLSGPPSPEDELSDALTVLDAAGSERTAVLGYGAGGATAIKIAATHPERVGALVLYASLACMTAQDGYDWTHTRQERLESVAQTVELWGQGAQLAVFAPSVATDPRYLSWMSRMERLAASPGTIRAILESTVDIDVRDLLPTIRVPTLALHRRGDRAIDMRHSRYIAEHVPGARLIELEGEDNFPWLGDAESVLGEIEEFLTGGRSRSGPERALLTVMFTDIVDATSRARELGDGRWRDLLAAHDRAVREQLARFEGREVKTIGDSFLATFDGPPSRALRCARATVKAAAEIGIEIRIGMHTGECELIGDDVGGMAVHIAARVGAMAKAGEVLVSGTVWGTVAGAGYDFEFRGSHALKGVGTNWPLFVLRD